MPLAAAEALSVTLSINEYVPAVVGMPEMIPAVLRVRPAGRLLPEATAHVYGDVPPVAETELE